MKVIVIYSNQSYAGSNTPFPPVGAIGTIISEIDGEGDYEVVFDEYPCDTPDDPAWFTHKSMIVFAPDPPQKDIISDCLSSLLQDS